MTITIIYKTLQISNQPMLSYHESYNTNHFFHLNISLIVSFIFLYFALICRFISQFPEKFNGLSNNKLYQTTQ